MDDDGDELGDEGELGFPSGSFRPGRVVWAKVDGHEWWPAKVTLHWNYLHTPSHSAKRSVPNASTFSLPSVSLATVECYVKTCNFG